MDGVDYAKICDLAREEALHAVKRLMQDRMIQGEALDAEGLLRPDLKSDDHDDEVFAAYESYLTYIHYIIEQTPIPLHV